MRAACGEGDRPPANAKWRLRAGDVLAGSGMGKGKLELIFGNILYLIIVIIIE